MTDELRNIITGTIAITEGDFIQTALHFLRECQKTGGAIEESELFSKEDEVSRLKSFASNQNLWFDAFNKDNYIGEGAEQKVYLRENGKKVIKINDTIFYETWSDYFISLLIHNYLFPSTAYYFLGFYQDDKGFYGVVEQPFIKSDEETDLVALRLFLEKNGFKHKRNNDYYSDELGIILEDLHDENVLTNQGVFFVIDSAIYVLKEHF